jgi:O-antigen/teichoic acid export membrane protein
MSQIKTYTVFGRQIGYIMICDVVVVILNILLIPVITSKLGTALYGTYSLINATVSFIVPFSMLSLNMGIIRFLAAEKDKYKIRDDYLSAISFVLISGVIFSGLMFLLSDLIATYIFKDPNQALYIRIGSALVLLNSLFPLILAFFRRGSNIGIFSILNLSLNILNFGMILLFVLLGYKLTGVLIATIISLICINIIGLILILKQIGFRRPHFSNIKSYLKWGIPLAPNSAIMWIIQASDRYIIGYFLGVSAVGIYNAAYSIGYYSAFALMPIGIVLYPMVSKTYDEGNLEECSNYFHYSFKLLMMVSIPAATGLSILAKPLLQILTTPEFVPGIPVVALVAFGALFTCFQQLCSYIIHLVGKTRIIIKLLSIAAVLNIILNIILIPYLGIVGAGIGSLISHFVLGLLTLFITRRYLKFDLGLWFIVKSLGSSAIMALIILLMKPESLFTVIISIILGIAVYFGLLILTRGITKTELSFAGSFIRKIIKV